MMKLLIFLPLLSCSLLTPQKRPQFTFQNSRWLNQHHFLLEEASKGKIAPHREALDFYRANFKGRDLLFDQKLTLLKKELSFAGNSSVLPRDAFPTAFENILTDFNDVYQEQLWDSHSDVNKEWINELKDNLSTHGPSVEKTLGLVLQTNLDDYKFLVDVVVVANWAGAYTSRDGHIVISSQDEKIKGLAALEAIYHEALHAGPYKEVDLRLSEEFKNQGKTDKFQLWHALQYFTVGEIVKRALAEKNIDYRPYAVANGLFGSDKEWGNFRTLFEKYWLPYLNGRVSMDEAIKSIVSEAYSLQESGSHVTTIPSFGKEFME